MSLLFPALRVIGWILALALWWLAMAAARASRRGDAKRARSLAGRGFACGGGSLFVSLLATIAGVAATFDAVADPTIDASQKARVLAEGISEVMNLMGFNAMLWVVPVVVATVVLVKNPARPLAP